LRTRRIWDTRTGIPVGGGGVLIVSVSVPRR
jgi:hypothetical protein